MTPIGIYIYIGIISNDNVCYKKKRIEIIHVYLL